MAGLKADSMDLLDLNLMVKLAKDKSSEGRAVLAQTVSRFFERSLTPQEKTLASGILFSLIKQAERDLREALSERLAVSENVPHDLILFLANDEISVAAATLRNSPVLTDADLMGVIASKSAGYWQAIACRENISAEVADTLIGTGDTQTVLNLIDNPRISFSKSSMKKIVRFSIRDEDVQAPLLRRPELDGELATDLYLCVSHSMRKMITERFMVSPSIIDRAMEALVSELASSARGIYSFTEDMLILAWRFQERGDISQDLLIKTLRRGQYAFFIALFAAKLRLSPDVGTRIVLKEGGKPLALACKAAGIMKPEFATVFLLSRGIRTGDKVIDQRELALALKEYDLVKMSGIFDTLRSWGRNPDLI